MPYYTYGILIAFAILFGAWLFFKNARKTSIQTPEPLDFLLIVSIAGLVGSRLMYVLLFSEQFKTFKDVIAIHEGGLVFYGGLILATILLTAYFRLKKLDILALCDCIIPSLAFGQALGRLGCLINHCCYGSQTDLIHIYKLPYENVFRHPTQAYEAVFMLIFGLITQFRVGKTQKGCISLSYFFTYSLWRFCIEFIRDDARGHLLGIRSLSPAQVISLLIIITCAKYIYKQVKYKL